VLHLSQRKQKTLRSTPRKQHGLVTNATLTS
jgi:hypothetical protein